MVEIKFRLIEKKKIVGYERWNSITSKWCYDISSDGVFDICNPFIFHTDKDQYTGLKDKNGKEIYEGDIVLCPEWDDYDKGTMKQVKRAVRWDNSDACFAAFFKEEPDREGYMLDNACNMEVISNIYENPELLEKE